MKRILGLLLVCLTCVSLAGCGNAENEYYNVLDGSTGELLHTIDNATDVQELNDIISAVDEMKLGNSPVNATPVYELAHFQLKTQKAGQDQAELQYEQTMIIYLYEDEKYITLSVAGLDLTYELVV